MPEFTAHDLALSSAWVVSLYHKQKTQDIDEALDVLFTTVSFLCERGEYHELNEAIAAIDVDRLETDLLVGVLASTASVKDRLGARPVLVARVRQRLGLIAPDRVELLMIGLD